jgi:hypothetical protein
MKAIMNSNTPNSPLLAVLISAVAVFITGGLLLEVSELDNPEPWRVAASTAGFVIWAMMCVLSARAWYRSDSAPSGASETLSGA